MPAMIGMSRTGSRQIAELSPIRGTMMIEDSGMIDIPPQGARNCDLMTNTHRQHNNKTNTSLQTTLKWTDLVSSHEKLLKIQEMIEVEIMIGTGKRNMMEGSSLEVLVTLPASVLVLVQDLVWEE